MAAGLDAGALAAAEAAACEAPAAAPAATRRRALGNRAWRVPLLAGGTAILKLHRPRRRAGVTRLRGLLNALRRCKTGVGVSARRATEERLLRHWAAAGCDVPRLLPASAAGLAPGPALLLEDLGSLTLLDRLAPRARLAGAERSGLLRRFAAALARRQRLALDCGDPLLVHEHGSLDHVLLCGERLVTFDLEQAFLAHKAVLPLLTKELVSTLRSLARVVDVHRLRADLDDLVAGYGDRALLGEIVREGLASASPRRRLMHALDNWWSRRRRADLAHDKRALLVLLRAALDGRPAAR